MPVDPLPVPAPDETAFEILAGNDAVRLFSERAAAVLPSFRLDKDNAAAVATLCRRVDGLPLAIELVAAQSKLLPPTEMLTQLGDRLHLLPNARDAPARQRTIHDTIAWSYDLLGPDAQWLFRRLAVFAGGWTLEAAGGAQPAWRCPDVLARVEAWSIRAWWWHAAASRTEPALHDAGDDPRVWAGTAQRTRRGDDARDRHAAFFRDLIVTKLDLYRTKRGERSWFARAVAEESNLRQALAWLVTARRWAGLARAELRAPGVLDVPRTADGGSAVAGAGASGAGGGAAGRACAHAARGRGADDPARRLCRGGTAHRRRACTSHGQAAIRCSSTPRCKRAACWPNARGTSRAPRSGWRNRCEWAARSARTPPAERWRWGAPSCCWARWRASPETWWRRARGCGNPLPSRGSEGGSGPWRVPWVLSASCRPLTGS